MNVILLCAGFGTRLHPLTKNTPKGLLEVAGRPILDYQLPQLIELPGLEALHLVSNAHYVAQFYRWADKWRSELNQRNIAFHLHNDGSLQEDKRLGAVGDLFFALRQVDRTQPVIITAGDNIFRFPLKSIGEEFLNTGENIILALREQSYQVRQRYAVVEFGEDTYVVRLHDASESPPSEWICPSLYCLQPESIALVESYLEEGGANDSFAQFINYLIRHTRVRALKKPNARVWMDVETRYMYRKANDVLEVEPLMVEDEI